MDAPLEFLYRGREEMDTSTKSSKDENETSKRAEHGGEGEHIESGACNDSGRSGKDIPDEIVFDGFTFCKVRTISDNTERTDLVWGNDPSNPLDQLDAPKPIFRIRKAEVTRCSCGNVTKMFREEHSVDSTRGRKSSLKSNEKECLIAHMVVDIECIRTTFRETASARLIERTTRTMYTCNDVQRSVHDFRELIKDANALLSREMRKIDEEVVAFSTFLYEKIFLRPTENISHPWMQRLYTAKINSILQEMVLMCDPSRFASEMKATTGAFGSRRIRQILDDFFGIQKMAKSSYAERKMFVTSYSMARSRGPTWNEVYHVSDGSPTHVLVGQLPEQWHVQMLLHNRGVRSILSVVEAFELDEVDARSAWHIPGIVQKHITVADFRGGGGVELLVEGVRFIQKQLRLGPVYVHCKAGKGRSVLMVMAWLMKHASKRIHSPLDAFHAIVMHRPQINPDTLITHTKVKEAHEYWLRHVMSLGDVLADGVVLPGSNDATTVEKWIDDAIGSGMIYNDYGGYCRARDRLVKWYGGSSAAQKLQKIMTADEDVVDKCTSGGANPTLLRDLWTSAYGLNCGPEEGSSGRLKEVREKLVKKGGNFKSSVAYREKHIAPIVQLRDIFESKVVGEAQNVSLGLWGTSGDMGSLLGSESLQDSSHPTTSTVSSIVQESIGKWKGSVRLCIACSSPYAIIDVPEKIGKVRYFVRRLDSCKLNRCGDGNIVVMEKNHSFAWSVRCDSDGSRMSLFFRALAEVCECDVDEKAPTKIVSEIEVDPDDEDEDGAMPSSPPSVPCRDDRVAAKRDAPDRVAEDDDETLETLQRDFEADEGDDASRKSKGLDPIGAVDSLRGFSSVRALAIPDDPEPKQA